MSFSELYPPLASLLALLSISSFFLRINKIFPSLCTVFYSYLYFAGMLRYKGDDLLAYEQSYYTFNANNQVASSDIFYIGFTNLFSYIGVPFIFFLFFCSLLGIYTLNHLSKYFNVPFYLISPLFLTSVIIVRDFSQLRVGLAIYLALLLVCQATSPSICLRFSFSWFYIYSYKFSFFFLSYYFAN